MIPVEALCRWAGLDRNEYIRRGAPHGLGSLCMGTALPMTRCLMGKLQTLYHPPERPCTPKGCPVKFRQGFLHFQGISLHQEAPQRLQTLSLRSLCCQRKVWTTGVQVNWSHWESFSAEVGQSRMREMTEMLRGEWDWRAELPSVLWGSRQDVNNKP